MAVFRTPPRRRNRRSCLIFLIILIFFIWIEFISLYAKSLFWKVDKAEDAVSILLVADPQLIGYRDESQRFGALTRWDSDRYLRRAFTRAASVVKPDYVIFLGDLFDEGVKMSENEFKYTLDRFNEIFPVSSIPNRLYVPGDNDVGGEMEPVYPHLEQRFDKTFPNRLSLTGNNFIQFAKVNYFAGNSVHRINRNDGLKILLSHMPLVRYGGALSTDNIIDGFKPDIILSAHDHTAEYYVKKKGTVNFSRFESQRGLKFTASPGLPTVEIQVPTMSYRMGVPDMGMGLLTIRRPDQNYEVKYETLWLPGRYPQLYAYIFGLFALLLYSFWDYIRVVLDKCGFGRIMSRFKVTRQGHRYVPV